jgi:hypothetical protein
VARSHYDLGETRTESCQAGAAGEKRTVEAGAKQNASKKLQGVALNSSCVEKLWSSTSYSREIKKPNLP